MMNKTYILPLPTHNISIMLGDTQLLYRYDDNNDVFLLFMNSWNWARFYIKRGDKQMADNFRAFALWLKRYISPWQAIKLQAKTTFICGGANITERFILGYNGLNVIEATLSYRCFGSIWIKCDSVGFNLVGERNVRQFINNVKKTAEIFDSLANFILADETTHTKTN